MILLIATILSVFEMLSKYFIFQAFRNVLNTKINTKTQFHIYYINKHNIMLPLLSDKERDYMFRLEISHFQVFLYISTCYIQSIRNLTNLWKSLGNS
jgi:hypothetical protein